MQYYALRCMAWIIFEVQTGHALMLRQAVLGSKFQNLVFLLLPFARRTAQEKIRFYATLSQTLNLAPAPISAPPLSLSCSLFQKFDRFLWKVKSIPVCFMTITRMQQKHAARYYTCSNLTIFNDDKTTLKLLQNF